MIYGISKIKIELSGTDEMPLNSNFRAADWIAHHARFTPSQIACIDYASMRQRTYLDLHSRVSRLAAYLHNTARIRPGARILVLSRNDIDVFEIQFACQRAGLIFVPVNWRLTEREISFIAEDCAADTLFYGSEFGEVARFLTKNGRVTHTFEMKCGQPSSYESCIVESRPLMTPVAVGESDCWALIYTSGTTGHPKGAIISYRMAQHNAAALCTAYGIDQNSRNLVVLPTFHTGGLNVFANPAFFRGAANVVMRDFEPREVIEILSNADAGISHLMAVPTMHAMLIAEPGFPELGSKSRLTAIAVAGAKCPETIIDAYDDIGLQLRQFWGMTEAGPAAIIMPPDNPKEKRAACGLPSMFVEAAIAAPNGQEAADGVMGELLVRGSVVTTGYWQRIDATEAAFCDEGWFRTGDAAYRDSDGYFYIVDRQKDMYISGGENIYPAEIERVLLLLDEVAECAVVAMHDDKWGEVGQAFVVCGANARVTTEKLLSHCGKHLARYKIPKQFVFTEALPRNASGKVLKHVLRGQSHSVSSRERAPR